MTQILRLVFQVSWWLGLLNILAAVVVKLLRLEYRADVTGHTLFLVATTFFLCALATREMQKARQVQ
jgi:uncharacterized membrane protein